MPNLLKDKVKTIFLKFKSKHLIENDISEAYHKTDWLIQKIKAAKQGSFRPNWSLKIKDNSSLNKMFKTWE